MGVSPKSDRRVILFDLGGVLVESAGPIVLTELLPHMSDRQVMERWYRSPAVNRFERGQISSRRFAEELIREWDLQLGESEFIASFTTWVTGLCDGAKSLVESLRKRHFVACLSNTNSIHWARLSEVQEVFDWCFASHLTGFVKPDREAYEHALAELQVKADAVYFFDDMLPNVTAARSAGMNAFHVSGFTAIAPVLRAKGLLADNKA